MCLRTVCVTSITPDSISCTISYSYHIVGDRTNVSSTSPVQMWTVIRVAVTVSYRSRTRIAAVLSKRRSYEQEKQEH